MRNQARFRKIHYQAQEGTKIEHERRTADSVSGEEKPAPEDEDSSLLSETAGLGMTSETIVSTELAAVLGEEEHRALTNAFRSNT